MFLVFVDECGYAKNWKAETSIKQQPVHVAAAVAIDANDINGVYKQVRDSLRACNLPHTDVDVLGKGEEIKAAPVDRGEGFWGKNSLVRDRVRQAYLDISGACYIVVCIDKARHKAQYSHPQDPAVWSLHLLAERIQGFVQEGNTQAMVLIDVNKREEVAQRSWLSRLQRLGSYGFGVSRFYGTVYKWKLTMANILEIHFGDSSHSLGLQIADFVARHTYSWWKSGKRQDYPGWTLIEPRLWRYPHYNGWGYKEFP